MSAQLASVLRRKEDEDGDDFYGLYFNPLEGLL